MELLRMGDLRFWLYFQTALVEQASQTTSASIAEMTSGNVNRYNARPTTSKARVDTSVGSPSPDSSPQSPPRSSSRQTFVKPVLPIRRMRARRRPRGFSGASGLVYTAQAGPATPPLSPTTGV